eukprot:33529-Eustigmatos_ZCMA.PRE.1
MGARANPERRSTKTCSRLCITWLSSGLHAPGRSWGRGGHVGASGEGRECQRTTRSAFHGCNEERC